MSVLGLFSQLCLPAKVYLVVQLVAIVMQLLTIDHDKDLHVWQVLIIVAVQLGMSILWTWFIQLVCQDNQKWWAWFLVIGVPLVWVVAAALLAGII
jgi:hypothetical protein